MSKTPMDRVTALTEIKAAIEKHGLTYPGEKPEALTVPDMCRRVSVFQRRELSGRHAEDERHIETLRKVIGTNPEKPRMLDKIVVWWGGNRWYVIDGHHRREAYRRARVEVPVPVEVFDGTLEDAIAYAAGANSKDRLTMSKKDKMNSAWLLTVLGGSSRQRIADCCSVSTASVAQMRRARRDLLTTANPEGSGSYTVDELATWEWQTARDVLAGTLRDPDADWDPDEAVRHRAGDYRRRLYNAFGHQPQKDAEAFAMAMSDSDRSIPSKYVETAAWQEELEETFAAQAEEKLTEMLDYLEQHSRHPEAVRELRGLAYSFEYDIGPSGVNEEDNEVPGEDAEGDLEDF